MHLTNYVVIWSCLALVVLALALVRYLVSLHEDDNIHLSSNEQALIKHQITFLHMLGTIDRWGKTLTIVAFASGAALLAVYLHSILPA